MRTERRVSNGLRQIIANPNSSLNFDPISSIDHNLSQDPNKPEALLVKLDRDMTTLKDEFGPAHLNVMLEFLH